MKVIGKDRTSCDVCNPIDEILARLDALERRASAIVAKVQGLAPDGEGNVTLPTSSSNTDPLHGRVDAFAMSSEVKEAADDAHAYATTIADDVVVLQSDVEVLTKEVEALDPASVTALEQSVAALQQTVNQLSNLVGGFSAVIRDLEDQMPNKVDRTGDTMTGPLNVIDTVTGSRNTQAVNGNRLQNDLDNYAYMVRTTGDNIVGGTNHWTGRQIVNTFSPVRMGVGTPTGIWTVMAKVTLTTTNSTCRLMALVLFTQSSRMVLMQCYFRRSSSGPTCDVYLHKNLDVKNIAMNYDTTTGEILLLIRTPYVYQRPMLFPIMSSKDDNVTGSAILYDDTRSFTSPDLFPLPSTNYATYLGVDN